MKCDKHPRYKAVYQPRCQCLKCWIMYEKTVMEKLKFVRDEIRLLAYGED